MDIILCKTLTYKIKMIKNRAYVEMNLKKKYI